MNFTELSDKTLVLQPTIKKLFEAKILKAAFSWFLRIATLVLTISFLVFWFTTWGSIVDLPGGTVLIAALAMILALGAMYVFINVLILRSNEIAALPESKDYIVIPIIVVFAKLTGEILAVLFTFTGIAGFLFSLTDMGSIILKEIPLFGNSGGIVSGLTGLFIFLILGFLSLYMCYQQAEKIGVLVDIARNTKK